MISKEKINIVIITSDTTRVNCARKRRKREREMEKKRGIDRE